jgi:hypothetical protein
MTLHVVAIHDDDPTSTLADLAAADFIDGESIVQTRDGQVPILRGIHVNSSALSAVNSIVGLTHGFPYITLQPSTWKETEKLFHEGDVSSIPCQDTTTTTDFDDAIRNPFYLEDWNGGYNIQLTENMNWVNSGGSQWAAANGTATNMTILLVYQYGPAIPWNGVAHPCVRVQKKASADTSADVWSEVANELLTDDGLDPDAVYRPLMGYCFPEGAGDKLTMAWRMTTTDHKTWIGGLGPGGNYCGYVRTTFPNDSMLINGDTQVKFECITDAACKPSVVVYFQEVKKGAEPRSVAPRASPAAAKGPSRTSLRLPTTKSFAGMFGR